MQRNTIRQLQPRFVTLFVAGTGASRGARAPPLKRLLIPCQGFSAAGAAEFFSITSGMDPLIPDAFPAVLIPALSNRIGAMRLTPFSR